MKKTNSITKKLLMILIPLVMLTIVILMTIIYSKSKNIIVSEAKTAITKESSSNQQTLEKDVTGILAPVETAAQALSNIQFTDNDAITNYLVTTRKLNDNVPNGLYLGFADETLINGFGYVPTADFKITTRQWYKEGVNNSTFTFGVPYIDETTGGLVVTATKSMTLSNGSKCVGAADVLLDKISEMVSNIKVMDTGYSFLVNSTDSTILAHSDQSYNNTKLSEYGSDELLTGVSDLIASGSSDVKEIAGYYVKIDKVADTSWILVSCVKVSDILKQLSALLVFCIMLGAALIVGVSVIIGLTIAKIIRPAKALTEDIVRITDGDFTVEVEPKGNDEIAIMSHSMKTFIEKMRGTLTELQNVTKQLGEEAEHSKESSGSLSKEADDQSASMEQIKEAIDGMAQAVTELATNATELATAVDDMTQKGNSANDTMLTLVDKAQKGQSDMKNVQYEMNNVVSAMTEMNDVVEKVGESANRINDIIAMISSIAGQTNLLSLNASIEAARAGEAGKGFAVVADEIGNLASESANATTQIEQIIQEITNQMKELAEKSSQNMGGISESSAAVTVAGETFEEIFTSMEVTKDTVAAMIDKMKDVNEIAASMAAISEEQSASTEEISATMDTLAESATHVAEESRYVADSANTVSESSETIEGFVKAFKIQ